MTRTRAAWNASRFRPGDPAGFYESYFQRANHPDRPLAFWIRYTVFCPRGRPDEALGELWAIYFDGEASRITAVKEAFPISECHFSPEGLDVQIAGSTLTDRALHGQAASRSHGLRWALDYGGDEPPLLLLPESLYERGLPRAKALVGTPNARYRGTLSVDGEIIPIDGWSGSQNHNWGSRHTDRYAWGQVAGFDDAPDAFFECATAQVKIGPLWIPRLTFVVLRDAGQEVAINGIVAAIRATGTVESFVWTIDTRERDVRISASIEAPAAAFVGLRYPNPIGGAKTCLNTKLAGARITITQPGRPPRTLTTRHRAAFEILSDLPDDRVPIVL